jgi:hypothetical protein
MSISGTSWITIVEADGVISRRCTCCGAIAVELGNVRLQIDSKELASFMATARSIHEREQRSLHPEGAEDTRTITLVIAPGRLALRLTRAELGALHRLLEETWLYVLRSGLAGWPADMLN